MASPEAARPIPNLFAKEDTRPSKGRSFENLQAFLKRGAVAEVKVFEEGQSPDYSNKGIHYPPIGPRQTLSQWERNIAILYDYAFGEETLGQIGSRQENKITRSRVSQIVKKEAQGLLEGATEQSGGRFRLDKFDFGKPLTLLSRQRLSEVQGGISLEILRRIVSGEDLDYIKNGYKASQIRRTTIVLSGWGVTVPRKRESIFPRFEGLNNTDATDEAMQALLDEVDHRAYKALLKAGLIVTITSVAKKAGLNPSSRDIHSIYSFLRQNEIPAGKSPNKVKVKSSDGHDGEKIIAHYYFIANIDERAARRLLKRAPEFAHLRKNPILQIAGPKDKNLTNA